MEPLRKRPAPSDVGPCIPRDKAAGGANPSSTLHAEWKSDVKSCSFLEIFLQMFKAIATLLLDPGTVFSRYQIRNMLALSKEEERNKQRLAEYRTVKDQIRLNMAQILAYVSNSDSMVAKDNAIAESAVTWQVGSASTHHATGNRALLSDFKTVNDLNIQTGDGRRMAVSGRGSVITETVALPDVWFVPELRENIVSVSQLAELDCSIVFRGDTCYISDATDGAIIGKALVGENGMFKLEFLKVPLVN